jgi:2-oxoisovalerate dehydrogenase E2 component (dihydrolipoyl transacylase)
MKIFYLPDLGEGLAEAEIREWYVKVGDVVKVDQPLVSMETAKAVVDVPSPYAGKILELHGKENDVIKTGAPFISYETDEVIADKGSVVGKLETSEKKWNEGDVIIGAAKSQSTAIKAMPAARMLAQQMGVDLATITASGPNGLITPDDVKKAIGKSTTTSAAALTGEKESLHGVRRVMAQVMSQSHAEVVPVTIIEDADISHLEKGTDLTARILQAMVTAAKKEPALNAWFDGKNLERKLFSEVNIGLAVDSPEGLFVPVIKDAEKKSAEEFRAIVDEYKKTVFDRSIAPSNLQGATISLSNFGMIAGRYATPIIVPPAVAILGCGRVREAPVVKEGKIVAGKVLPLSLTFDHRAVTGGEATRFLRAVIEVLSQ